MIPHIRNEKFLLSVWNLSSYAPPNTAWVLLIFRDRLKGISKDGEIHYNFPSAFRGVWLATSSSSHAQMGRLFSPRFPICLFICYNFHLRIYIYDNHMRPRYLQFRAYCCKILDQNEERSNNSMWHNKEHFQWKRKTNFLGATEHSPRGERFLGWHYESADNTSHGYICGSLQLAPPAGRPVRFPLTGSIREMLIICHIEFNSTFTNCLSHMHNKSNWQLRPNERGKGWDLFRAGPEFPLNLERNFIKIRKLFW